MTVKGKYLTLQLPFHRAVVWTVQKGKGKSHLCLPLVVGHINGSNVGYVTALASECCALHSSMVQIWIVNARIVHNVIWRNVQLIVAVRFSFHIGSNEKLCNVRIKNCVVALRVRCRAQIFLSHSFMNNVESSVCKAQSDRRCCLRVSSSR